MLRDPSNLTDLGNTKHASDFSLTGAGVTNPCKPPSVCCELKLVSHYWATGTVSRVISGSAAGRSSEVLLRTTGAIMQLDYLSIQQSNLLSPPFPLNSSMFGCNDMNSNENDHGVTFYCVRQGVFHAAGALEGVYTPINSVIVIEDRP